MIIATNKVCHTVISLPPGFHVAVTQQGLVLLASYV